MKSQKFVEHIRQTQSDQEERRSSSTGSGLTIILPSDINELVDRHKLLFSELKAGNNGVFNEIQAINKVLLKKGFLSRKDIENFIENFSIKNEGEI